jgi:hypothetical protein
MISVVKVNGATFMKNAILNNDTKKQGFNAAVINLDGQIYAKENDEMFEKLEEMIRVDYKMLKQIQRKVNYLTKIKELTHDFGRT